LPEDSNFLGQPHRNRPAEFARTSLSAWGLPTPVVAFACIGNVDIRLFFLCKWVTLFHTAFASLHIASPERGGEPPLGGGGVPPQSVTSSAAMSKPSGGIRSLPSLSACGLPTPVVALACIGNVDIRLFFLCKWATLFHTAFASL
jgi:hypothetical protein